MADTAGELPNVCKQIGDRKMPCLDGFPNNFEGNNTREFPKVFKREDLHRHMEDAAVGPHSEE